MSFAKIRPRRGTASQWNNANPILAEGEIGIEVPSTGVGTGNVKIKFGDGSTHWNDLPYGVDTIGNNTDMISEKFTAGTPCVKDNYYIANDTLYKCLNNTDGSVDVSNTNYFKKTTVGAELSSGKSNLSGRVQLSLDAVAVGKDEDGNTVYEKTFTGSTISSGTVVDSNLTISKLKWIRLVGGCFNNSGVSLTVLPYDATSSSRYNFMVYSNSKGLIVEHSNTNVKMYHFTIQYVLA